jgi:hypothetical protein
MGQLNDSAFFARYGEVSRALTSTVLKHLSGTADATASKLLDLHRRHSRQVVAVLRNGLQMHAAAVLAGTLPDSCLITLAVPDKYRTPKTSIAPMSKMDAIEQHDHRPKSQYSGGDDTIYRETLTLCRNLDAFQVWTDSELLSRLRPHLQTNPAMRGRSENALRLCFRRIRRHHGFELSRLLKKNSQD